MKRVILVILTIMSFYCHAQVAYTGIGYGIPSFKTGYRELPGIEVMPDSSVIITGDTAQVLKNLMVKYEFLRNELLYNADMIINNVNMRYIIFDLLKGTKDNKTRIYYWNEYQKALKEKEKWYNRR